MPSKYHNLEFEDQEVAGPAGIFRLTGETAVSGRPAGSSGAALPSRDMLLAAMTVPLACLASANSETLCRSCTTSLLPLGARAPAGCAAAVVSTREHPLGYTTSMPSAAVRVTPEVAADVMGDGSVRSLAAAAAQSAPPATLTSRGFSCSCSTRCTTFGSSGGQTRRHMLCWGLLNTVPNDGKAAAEPCYDEADLLHQADDCVPLKRHAVRG